MAGFVDVLLRGLILVLTSVALGGVAWLRFVLRAEPHVKPDAPTALALRTLAAAATGAALAQAAVVLVGLTAVADAHGGWPLAAFYETTFALTATARVILAVAVAALALRLAHHAAPRLAWTALTLTATLLVASSAVVSHAVARVEWRLPLIALDAAHQVAAALWIGGLAHLVLLGVAGHASPPFARGGRHDRSRHRGRGGRALRAGGATAHQPADRRAPARGRSPDGPPGRAQARGAGVVGVQPPLGRPLRRHHGRAGDAALPRAAGGAPLAARVPRPRDVPLHPERSARVATRTRGVLGKPHAARRAPAPHVRLPRRRLRALRVDGAHGPAGGAAVGLRLPAALRGGRRAPAHPLARDVQPEGRVPLRGHARAARDPRRVRGLGPLAGAPAARGGARRRLDLARLLHGGGAHPPLLSRRLMTREPM